MCRHAGNSVYHSHASTAAQLTTIICTHRTPNSTLHCIYSKNIFQRSISTAKQSKIWIWPTFCIRNGFLRVDKLTVGFFCLFCFAAATIHFQYACNVHIGICFRLYTMRQKTLHFKHIFCAVIVYRRRRRHCRCNYQLYAYINSHCYDQVVLRDGIMWRCAVWYWLLGI